MPENLDKMRTTRRRNQPLNSSCELNARDRDSDVASPKSYVTTAAYMSPIDKLLIKNGANSPNSTGFEADAEDVALVKQERKQLKRKLKRGPKPKIKSTRADESAKKSRVDPNVEEQLPQAEGVMETTPDQPELSIKVEPMEEVVEQKIFQNDDQNDVEPKLKDEEIKDADHGPVESTAIDVEPLPSPPDHIEPANNSEQSIKSPSSISLDSAKGSSIVTDAGWPTYQVGDLYWGKLFTYCYWPCMVCPDQLGQIVGNPQSHPQRKSTDSAPGAPMPIQVHVRFFADNGRHNWIKSENLLPFAGLKAFQDLREEVRIKLGPRSTKYRQMVAKQNKLVVWHQAIDEADIVAQLPYAERMQKFFDLYESSM